MIARTLLTPRQLRIAELLVTTALSMKEIAATLNVSEGTIKNHAHAIYERLGIAANGSGSRLTLMLRWREAAP
jgi:DNA-binding NarL/FixJ family response regulator